MMFKRLSVLTVLVLLGVSFLVLTSSAHAQRGGFGRGGFGRGGSGGHNPGHSGASVNVFQAGGNFFQPHFGSGRNGFNSFGARSHFSPFPGNTVTRFPGVFVHGPRFGFFFTDGFSVTPGFNSSLGFPIPPISMSSSVNPFFLGIGPRLLFPQTVFPSVVDLGTISPITAVSIDSARTSNSTIVNLPANAFRGVHK